MRDYYLLQRCNLEAKDGTLKVTGETTRRIPATDISGLHLIAGYTITSGVIGIACRFDFPIHVYSYSGRYQGSFFPPPVDDTADPLVRQVESRMNTDVRRRFSSTILAASYHAMEELLRPLNLELPPGDLVDPTRSRSLMEARVRKAYYALLDTVLPPPWSIVVRNRRPPRRPADAVLGFGNSLLYAKMAGWVHQAGLDPRIGYLHGGTRAKNPLALDLADILKPALSETILLEIATSSRVIDLTEERDGGVYLQRTGRRLVIQAVEDALQATVVPVGGRRSDTLENWARSIPRVHRRAILDEVQPTYPVIPCTLSSSTMQRLRSGRTSVPS